LRLPVLALIVGGIVLAFGLILTFTASTALGTATAAALVAACRELSEDPVAPLAVSRRQPDVEASVSSRAR